MQQSDVALQPRPPHGSPAIPERTVAGAGRSVEIGGRDPIQDTIESVKIDLDEDEIRRLSGDSGEAERLFRREAERHSGMIPNTTGA